MATLQHVHLIRCATVASISLATAALAACSGGGKPVAPNPSSTEVDSGAMSIPDSGMSPMPEKIALGTQVKNLALWNGDAYWADWGTTEIGDPKGHIAKLVGGAGMRTILSQGDSTAFLFARALAFDANNIYWSDGQIKTVRLVGGRTDAVWADTNCISTGPAAIDGPNIYWFANCSGTTDAWLLTSPVIVGYPAKVVATGIGKDWSPALAGAENPRGLVVADGAAYWSNVTGSVVTLPLTGGLTPTVLAGTSGGVATPRTVVIHASRLYYEMIDYKLQARGSIETVALDGTDGKVIASGLKNETETGLAVDDEFVYWSTDQALFKAPLGGGAAVTVVAARNNPTNLAVDSARIYWTENEDVDQRLFTGVYRMAK